MTSCQYEGYKDNANAMYISERRPIYINIYHFFQRAEKGSIKIFESMLWSKQQQRLQGLSWKKKTLNHISNLLNFQRKSTT